MPLADSWMPYTPAAKSPWHLRRVVHLHRRAGFAATWSEIQRDLKDGPDIHASRLTEKLEGSPRRRELQG